MKNIIKELNKHFSERYKLAVEQFYNKFLTTDDLELLITHEKTVIKTINDIKAAANEQVHKNLYNTIVKTTAAETLLTSLKARLIILEEEHARLSNQQIFTPSEIQARDRKINDVEENIKATKAYIDAINNTQAVVQPKRRPGRPKGSKKTPGAEIIEMPGTTTPTVAEN